MRALVRAALAVTCGCTGVIDGGLGGLAGTGPAAEAAGCAPASFALTRLNRRELDATFAALLHDEARPARLFVADSVTPGAFDNAAAELTISPRLVVDLEAAATGLIDAAWARDDALARRGAPSSGGVHRQLGRQAQATVGAARGDDWNLWSNGEARFVFAASSAGTHHFELDVYGEQAGTEAVRMDVWLNGAVVRTESIAGTQANHTTVAFDASLAAGTVTVGLRFTNDVFDAATGTDRNLLISSVSLRAPVAGPSTVGDARPVLQVCPVSSGEACARTILERFARRAWRRPATGDELAGLVSLVEALRAEGDDVTTATKVALRAVLSSPNFLLRTEAVMPAEGPRAPAAVAARLAFFLWGAPPDERLDAKVDDRTLLDEQVLGAEIERMLRDPKARALRTEFVGQWLDTRGVQAFALDPGLFPGINQAVMQSVSKQIDAYVEDTFFADRDMLETIDAPVTFVDATLATFLGVAAPSGSGLERRALPRGDPRSGLLGQSAPLMVTSKSTETDPPRRGKWVVERLLCQPISLPTSIEVPPLPPPTPERPTARDRLEALTSPAACAGCHALLNPIGFGLETYGADSRERTTDHGALIDPSGTFRGKPFSTAAGLVEHLKADPALERCVVEKTLSYALNRAIDEDDADTVDALQSDFTRRRRFVELIRAVAAGPTMVNGCRLTK